MKLYLLILGAFAFSTGYTSVAKASITPFSLEGEVFQGKDALQSCTAELERLHRRLAELNVAVAGSDCKATAARKFQWILYFASEASHLQIHRSADWNFRSQRDCEQHRLRLSAAIQRQQVPAIDVYCSETLLNVLTVPSGNLNLVFESEQIELPRGLCRQMSETLARALSDNGISEILDSFCDLAWTRAGQPVELLNYYALSTPASSAFSFSKWSMLDTAAECEAEALQLENSLEARKLGMGVWYCDPNDHQHVHAIIKFPQEVQTVPWKGFEEFRSAKECSKESELFQTKLESQKLSAGFWSCPLEDSQPVHAILVGPGTPKIQRIHDPQRNEFSRESSCKTAAQAAELRYQSRGYKVLAAGCERKAAIWPAKNYAWVLDTLPPQL